MNKDLLLPNSLPIYKELCLKPTKEKCRFIKLNPTHTKEMPVYDPDNDTWIDKPVEIPASVDVKIFRTVTGIVTSNVERVLLDDLIVWNESMNPRREVTYKRRNKCRKTVIYN